MFENRGPWLGQVPLVPHRGFRLGNAPGAADFFPGDSSTEATGLPPAAPPAGAIQTAVPSGGKAVCVTVGPVSALDPKKVSDFLQAQPPGKFWIYPHTSIGPGDQDYVVWCNAFATPVAGAKPWSPPGTPSAGPAETLPSPVGTATSTPTTALAVGGGLAAAGLLALLAFR